MHPLLLLALVLTLVSFQPFAAAMPVTRGPYLQMATDTSVTIRWRTQSTEVGEICYGSDPLSLINKVTEGATTTEHSVTLGALTPSTVYYYSVGTAGTVHAGGDASHRFSTAPLPNSSEPTRIWVLGDPGTGTSDQIAVRNAFMNFTGTRIPDALLTLGDNAYPWGTDSEYQSFFFNPYAPTLRQTPLWPSLGNHDTANSTDPAGNYPYFQIFTLPTAGEAGGLASGKEHYYSFDRGNIHFICLDSMTSDRSSTGPMANWLRNDLASTTERWIIAYWHHPPYSKGSHTSEFEQALIQMRTGILPILETGGVDLVLCGHSHSYERSFLIDGHYGFIATFNPSMIKDGGNGRESGTGAYRKDSKLCRANLGTVVVVMGSSGSVAGGPLNHPVMIESLNLLGSLAIDVAGNRMDVSYIQPTGVPFGSSHAIADSFTIIKEILPDYDCDGMADDWELLHGLDPNDPADALLDRNADGVTNLDEFLLVTQPTISGVPRVLTQVDPQAMTTQIAYFAAIGRSYRVYHSPDLIQWSPGTAWISGDDSVQSWIDAWSPGKRFLRLEYAP